MKKNKYLRIIYVFVLIATLAVVLNVFLVAGLKVHIRSLTNLSSYVDSVSMVSENIYGNRGYIYDSNGQVVAQNENTYDIICYLSKSRKGIGDEIAYVDDPLYTSQVLAQILGGDQTTIFSQLTSNPSLYQTELGTVGRNLSQSTVEQIMADEHLHGIGFKVSTKRIYPLGSSFSPYLIGFSQSDENGKQVGKMGVEAYLNNELSGTDGKHVYQADKNGYILPGMYEYTEPASDGDSVYLTLDASIQEALTTAFEEEMAQNGAQIAWGAVMDIESGKLLAYGQAPSFDPNIVNIEDYNNYGSQYAYEPGSVLKSIIYATAIDTGVYNGENTFDSSPYCYYAGADNIPYRTYSDTSFGCINNAAYKNWGSIPLDYGLIYSSNVATSTLLTDYIKDPIVFEEYLKRFGFFQYVDIDGIPEVSGTKNFYYASEKLALTFGQGSSVTMLQLLQAYSAIYGNGEMVKPYYIDRVVNENGEVVYKTERTVTGTPIKESTAKQMQALLARVVSDPSGTAKFYGIDEVAVAAKTGTSEIAVIGEGYRSDLAITSVMMAFPAEQPKTMIYFAFVAPYDYNMHAYSKPVNDLTKKVYLLTSNSSGNRSTSGLLTSVVNRMPDYTGSNALACQDELRSMGAQVVVIGEGETVLEQYPYAEKTFHPGDRVFLLTTHDSFSLTDFSDWTRKDLLTYANLCHLSIGIEGSGLVYWQSVSENAVVSNGDTIVVKCKNIHTDIPVENITEEPPAEGDRE